MGEYPEAAANHSLLKCCPRKMNSLRRNRDPTPKNILGVHWDMTRNGEILHYLAINRTENSTTLWNYRPELLHDHDFRSF